METQNQQQILSELSGFIVEVVGDELELTGPIGMATSFGDDLELESIEFVALAELIQARYGERIDFVSWLSDKELDEIIKLTVGELVEYIIACH